MKQKKNNEMPSGKLSPAALERNVLRFNGAANSNLLIGPGVGEDAAVIKWDNNRYMIFCSDPIVGADKGAGKLLVRINSNDVASKGGDPLYLTVTLILPPSYGEEGAAAIMKEINDECIAENIAIAGGHTEFNDKYDKPVIMGALVGAAERVLDAKNIRSGDYILVTKHIGIEGMSILAADRPDLLETFMTADEISKVLSWSDDTSVLEDSRILRDYAVFMHDPTEGGFAGGLSEIALLSGIEFDIDETKIPVDNLTRKAAEHLHFDPLHLIASGSLLAVIKSDDIEKAKEGLEKAGLHYAVIGRAGKTADIEPEEPTEELWRLLRMEVIANER